MHTRIRILLLLTTLGLFSCTDTPEAVYDNPLDPENTSAPLFAPHGLVVTYFNDHSVRILWTEDNFSTEGFVVERTGVWDSSYVVIAERPREGFEIIPVPPVISYYSMYDTTVLRSAVGYTYRVKAYNRRNGLRITSPYSGVGTFVFP